MDNNIVLIGMPASGKSTTGRVLANTLNKNFIDTDDLIMQEEGMPLQDIINSRGNDYFAQVEDRVLSNLSCSNTVIATGGSAVFCKNGMKHLRTIGTIVYLRVDYGNIKKRLHNLETRGITLEKGQSIKDLYDYRVPFYEKEADYVVDNYNKSAKVIINNIINELNLRRVY